MLKKYIVAALAPAFLLTSVPAFADHWEQREERRGFHGDFHREHIVHRLGPGYISLMVGELALLYSEGMFYRYTPAGYIVVTPPVGAVVPALPPGYTMIYESGVPYYYYGYTYYAPAPNGFAVVASPVAPAAPQYAVPSMAPQAPIASPATSAPAQPALAANVSNAMVKAEEPNHDVYDIYIPNGNGSYTSVTLKKTEKGFLGPQGEFYADHPTVEQLRERYIKK